MSINLCNPASDQADLGNLSNEPSQTELTQTANDLAAGELKIGMGLNHQYENKTFSIVRIDGGAQLKWEIENEGKLSTQYINLGNLSLAVTARVLQVFVDKLIEQIQFEDNQSENKQNENNQSD